LLLLKAEIFLFVYLKSCTGKLKKKKKKKERRKRVAKEQLKYQRNKKEGYINNRIAHILGRHAGIVGANGSERRGRGARSDWSTALRAHSRLAAFAEGHGL
jgi:hypothetical protein